MQRKEGNIEKCRERENSKRKEKFKKMLRTNQRKESKSVKREKQEKISTRKEKEKKRWNINVRNRKEMKAKYVQEHLMQEEEIHWWA